LIVQDAPLFGCLSNVIVALRIGGGGMNGAIEMFGWTIDGVKPERFKLPVC
jgi:hypothetical protein